MTKCQLLVGPIDNGSTFFMTPLWTGVTSTALTKGGREPPLPSCSRPRLAARARRTGEVKVSPADPTRCSAVGTAPARVLGGGLNAGSARAITSLRAATRRRLLGRQTAHSKAMNGGQMSKPPRHP
mmetsp:Transcript_8921/g.23341  ORF Transcript_8921/g.23341 Transcript_8921/m.23341 type:complete len:126 (+) Transcript_8921:376-753(+)